MYLSIAILGQTGGLFVLMLPSLLRELPVDMFENFGGKPFPQIRCLEVVDDLDQVFDCKVLEVVLENCVIAKTDDLLVAFQVTFACFYIFNLEYPKCLAATLTYIQKDVIDLQDSALEIGKVVNLITKVRRSALNV